MITDRLAALKAAALAAWNALTQPTTERLDGGAPTEADANQLAPMRGLSQMFTLDVVKKEVTFPEWHLFNDDPEDRKEVFSFAEVLNQEAALDASDSLYGRWRYAEHCVAEELARQAILALPKEKKTVTP